MFSNIKCAKHAIDVFFQQDSRPASLLLESRHYFSGKHNLYGFKTEVSVTLGGKVIYVSRNVPGSVHEKAFFQKNNLAKHKAVLMKKVAEFNLTDNGG